MPCTPDRHWFAWNVHGKFQNPVISLVDSNLRLMVTLELSNGIAWFWNIPCTFHANQCPSSVHSYSMATLPTNQIANKTWNNIAINFNKEEKGIIVHIFGKRTYEIKLRVHGIIFEYQKTSSKASAEFVSRKLELFLVYEIETGPYYNMNYLLNFIKQQIKFWF